MPSSNVLRDKVVNVSSVSGTRGAATQIGYSAGKAAVGVSNSQPRKGVRQENILLA